jgi:translation initiation factor IF-2
MTNEYNKVLKTATPSTPVSVIGLSEVPVAGDSFMAFSSEKQAKEIAEKRRLSKESSLRSQSNANSVELLNQKLNSGEISDINLIIKADNTGSAEAIKSSLDKIQLETVKVRVLRSEAGSITESDVLLASASSAIIYGFNIRPDATIKSKAEAVGVDIRHHRIIYALLEEVEALSKGKLKVKMVEKITGQFSVRATFKLGKVGIIAGGLVTEGTIFHKTHVRIKRNGVTIAEDKIESLKRLKDEVKDVRSGFECGIKLENFNDIAENDVFEAYQMVEEK